MIYLEITSAVLRSVHNWWYEVIRPLRDLFSLAMDRSIAVTRFEVIDEREPEKRAAKRIFFKERGTPLNEGDLDEENMLFSRNDITGDIGRLMNNWLRMSSSSEFSIFCNLYSSVTRTKDQYIDEEFLSLSQAVEIYHRLRLSNTVLPQEEWQKKVNKILEKVQNKDEQKWLKEKLFLSNIPPLQNRLEELLDKLEPTTSLLVADKKGFAELVKHTKYHLIRWDTKEKKKATSYSDLYFVSRTLRYLITACLLKELGFDSVKIAELLKKNVRFDKFRRNSDNIIAHGFYY
ncbi:MAG: hypothetical protein D3923_03185 [Candidatus Electrothrix sp. AR3]|nr:hypothetical protein [Candidatus Electrothrix sp. AR3]